MAGRLVVGIRSRAPFIQDDVSGVFVNCQTPSVKCLKNDADAAALATFVDGIRRIQQTDRQWVRAVATEVFGIERILAHVVAAFGDLRPADAWPIRQFPAYASS